MIYDVAVVGLGAMGSAVAQHCAARGASVVGLEQFAPGHDLGSSTGKSRMIRKAYFEDPAYVPLLLRAYELWRELERSTGDKLLTITGLLMVGEEGSEIIAGSQRAAREHGLPIESLGQDEIRARYPMLKLLPGEIGVFEHDGGVLNPERAVRAQLATAEARGAHLHFGAEFVSWQPAGEGLSLLLSNGTRIQASALVLTMGPWLGEPLAACGIQLRVQRNVQVWFSPSTEAYAVGQFPAFLLDRAGLPAPLYGFPDSGDGVKAAFHSLGEIVRPQDVNRRVDQARDIAPVAAELERWMPGAATTYGEAKVCLYSLSPDCHFIVDRHPADRAVILCGGFSGHGFKFAPVIGEIVAELILEGSSHHPIDFLSLQRFERDGES